MSCEKRGGEKGDKKATERGRGQKQTPLIRYPQTNGHKNSVYGIYVRIDPVADMHAGSCLVSNCVRVCVCE